VEKIIKVSFEQNCATVMAKSGARASMTHLTQLSAFTGQARILGERIHRGYKDRTLSHFTIGDLSAAAHGFSENSFKSGLNPFEFFFDAVSGRESLMDKSLRTRHSGYLERRLMNALQDLKVEYSYNVVDNRKIIVQFTAGEDRIDPAKSDWGALDIKSIIQSVIR
jgi:DNA-directed RNA polymerase subunit A'